MKYLNTTPLLTTALITTFFVSQFAIADEIIRESDLNLDAGHSHQMSTDLSESINATKVKPRVNYSMSVNTQEKISEQGLFPEAEQ